MVRVTQFVNLSLHFRKIQNCHKFIAMPDLGLFIPITYGILHCDIVVFFDDCLYAFDIECLF